jgi:hypothetical protein
LDLKNQLKHRKLHQQGLFIQLIQNDNSIFHISLRAIYGKDLVHNAIDVSPDVQQAKNDINLLFGDLDRDEQGEKSPIKFQKTNLFKI